MGKFFNKLFALVALPGLLLAAATSPLNCSCSVAKDGGVFRSDNFGVGWQQKVKISDKKDIAGVDILSLAINYNNPNIIYLGTNGSGIYKTTNSGDTWQLLEDKNKILLSNAQILDIKINPRSQDLIYAAVYQNSRGFLLRSRDGGAGWEQIYSVSKEKMAVQIIEIDKTNEAIIYIGTAEGGLLKSTDFGASWQTLGWFDSQILDIKIDPANNQIVYFASENKGIQKSINQGQSWQSVSLDGLISSGGVSQYTYQPGVKNASLMINPKNPNNIYFVSQKGFLVSQDGGQSWQALNILMPKNSVPILSIAQDQQNPNIIYYGAGSVVYRSNDSGVTWTVNQLPSAKNASVIKIDPLNSNIIWTGIKN